MDYNCLFGQDPRRARGRAQLAGRKCQEVIHHQTATAPITITLTTAHRTTLYHLFMLYSLSTRFQCHAIFDALQRVYIFQMISMTKTVLVLLALIASAYSLTTVSSFKELAQAHCRLHPLETLHRLASGQLAAAYGPAFADIDCYIRQFVNKDGQDNLEEEEDSEADEEEAEELPQIDPLVEEYAAGLDCLPQGTDRVEAVYSLWRFYRFVLHHDYCLQWIRAKVRACLGYQAERPSSWMDGQQSAARLRLDKLFSNQFYDYVDKLMFRDFLHPIMTFLKKNLVFAAGREASKSGRPILIQILQSKNLLPKVFEPIVLVRPTGNIFTYTIPGVPLLLGGASQQVGWAFTGVLTDRSNIEQIQTLGNKFYHHGSETWVRLQNVSFQIEVKGEEPRECKFVHSSYGTLYEKHKSFDGGKVSEYIARWHQNEPRVRVLFSQLLDLVERGGQTQSKLEFPFSSLVIANNTGLYQVLCLQGHPSYFLYPDLAGAPEYGKERWVSNFRRNFLVVSNTHLTTKNQEAYLKKEVMNPTEEQFLIDTRRRLASGKFTPESLWEFVRGVGTDPLLKKRKDLLISIYRKTKFLFFPEESVRKECDQLVAMLQRWDNNLNSPSLSPVFILWDYFVKDNTFNYVSSSEVGSAIAKHKVITDSYWASQMELWKVGTSYGECDSSEWHLEWEKKLNNTGDNSTCFFNIMKAMNQTRLLLRTPEGSIPEPQLKHYSIKKIKDLREGYVGSHLEEAFAQFHSQNVAFVAEIGNPSVTFLEGYEQQLQTVNIISPPTAEETVAQSIQIEKQEIPEQL